MIFLLKTAIINDAYFVKAYDKGKLVPKRITDSLGRSMTKWVNPSVDALDSITLYHGSHKSNLNNILKHGITGPTTGYTANRVFLAERPDTAYGYASMRGGEHVFRVAGSDAVYAPEEDRVVFQIKLPKEYVEKHLE